MGGGWAKDSLSLSNNNPHCNASTDTLECQQVRLIMSHES